MREKDSFAGEKKKVRNRSERQSGSDYGHVRIVPELAECTVLKKKHCGGVDGLEVSSTKSGDGG